jgi:hypothetical protein
VRGRSLSSAPPLHAQRVNQWMMSYIKADENQNWDLWGQFDESVLQQIRAFQVPMIRLAASTSMDAVCAVFERVNTGGVPLNVFELLTATYAGDREYVDRTGDYYQLPRSVAGDQAGAGGQVPGLRPSGRRR